MLLHARPHAVFPFYAECTLQSCDETGLCPVVSSGVNRLLWNWLVGRVVWHRQNSAKQLAADIFRLGVVYFSFPGKDLINVVISYNDLAGLSSCELAASGATVSAASNYTSVLIPSEDSVNAFIPVLPRERRRLLAPTSPLQKASVQALKKMRAKWSAGGSARPHLTSDLVDSVVRSLQPDSEL